MAKRLFPNPLSRGPNKMSAFKRNWLSDPSAYPLIAIMGFAGAFIFGVGTSCLMYNPDVQIDPQRRGNTMRSWKFD